MGSAGALALRGREDKRLEGDVDEVVMAAVTLAERAARMRRAIAVFAKAEAELRETLQKLVETRDRWLRRTP